MTSKELAMNTLADINRNCDTALGYWSWQDRAEEAVNSAFQAARDYRKSITAVAKELVTSAYSMGERFGSCMSMAVGNTLTAWLAYGWLQGYEVKRARKILDQ